MTIKTVQAKGGKCGLKVIGGKNSHHRFQTPDGTKHRSVKKAIEHVESAKMTQAMSNLEKNWGVRVA